jgi:hypothetical protein
MTDRVIVRRADDQSLSELASSLISLADDPHEVVWEHRAGYLTVPEYVAARYAGTMDADEGTPAEAVDVEVPAVQEAPKRKPGRPRKTATAAVKEEVN